MKNHISYSPIFTTLYDEKQPVGNIALMTRSHSRINSIAIFQRKLDKACFSALSFDI